MLVRWGSSLRSARSLGVILRVVLGVCVVSVLGASVLLMVVSRRMRVVASVHCHLRPTVVVLLSVALRGRLDLVLLALVAALVLDWTGLGLRCFARLLQFVAHGI